VTPAEQLAEHEARLDHIEARFTDLHRDVRETRDAVVKQRGFLAGASMAFSMLGSALVGLCIYIWNYLR
jgi:hypothetical protein